MPLLQIVLHHDDLSSVWDVDMDEPSGQRVSQRANQRCVRCLLLFSAGTFALL